MTGCAGALSANPWAGVTPVAATDCAFSCAVMPLTSPAATTGTAGSGGRGISAAWLAGCGSGNCAGAGSGCQTGSGGAAGSGNGLPEISGCACVVTCTASSPAPRYSQIGTTMEIAITASRRAGYRRVAVVCGGLPAVRPRDTGALAAIGGGLAATLDGSGILVFCGISGCFSTSCGAPLPDPWSLPERSAADVSSSATCRCSALPGSSLPAATGADTGSASSPPTATGTASPEACSPVPAYGTGTASLACPPEAA